MAGETSEDERTGHPDEFLSKTKWQRFQVLIAGPAMNLLLAVVVLAAVLYRGAEVPVYEDQPVVVGVVAAGSPAEKAGIVPGDRITSVAGSRTDTWRDFLIAIGTRPNREIPITFVRNGDRDHASGDADGGRRQPVRNRRDRRVPGRASACGSSCTPASRAIAPASRPATSSSPSTASRSRSDPS